MALPTEPQSSFQSPSFRSYASLLAGARLSALLPCHFPSPVECLVRHHPPPVLGIEHRSSKVAPRGQQHRPEPAGAALTADATADAAAATATADVAAAAAASPAALGAAVASPCQAGELTQHVLFV